ncbi:hypothetical protein SAMN05192544_1011123 [Paraburkholderia hospita]|nr:hypothetical protein SAMN05192544_1011123 [Paraburkholderia hospita]
MQVPMWEAVITAAIVIAPFVGAMVLLAKQGIAR